MEYENEEELDRIRRDEYFQENDYVHIGSGSNLLFLNDYSGIVLHSAIKGITKEEETADSVLLRIGASEIWDEVVNYAVSNDWYGIENLSNIPGETGAAAIQNIGAYGVEIKDVVESVEAFSLQTGKKRKFAKTDCAYAYRYSRFKKEENPFIVTHVYLRLSKTPHFTLDYGNLKEELQNAHIHNVRAINVREAVIAIRKQKLPDPEEWGNAGSFFTNPIVSCQQFEQLKAQYPSIPSYPFDDQVKIPAGWLIEQCGFKGKTHGEVGVYEKQALVLINLGNATGTDIALVAESIRMTVFERFQIDLIPEVKYIG
ncbi:UDP-N-acetylenolpyruvoylglucosamine reductase [Bacteroidia bacterium]|nr:UDP-N-acetylenolpyruvoylglucosamine reductase [Bacteroidia bacterium]